MIEETKEEIRKYLSSNQWKRYSDSKREVFYKKRHPSNVRQFDFLRYSKRNIPYAPIEVADRTKDFMIKSGFDEIKAETIFGKYPDDPLFFTSGVQNLTSWIHGEDNPYDYPIYIAQPVIRTNFRDNVGKGKVSSFVNLSTLKHLLESSEHIGFIDLWMQHLSGLGFFVSDFNLELKEKDRNNEGSIWDKSEGVHLKFKYGGMELGSAGAIYPTINSVSAPLSDIGFGLERLVWAINKTDDFSDVLGPKPSSFSNNYAFADSLRTLTLLGIGGLSREDKDRFRQFRIYLGGIEKDSLDMIAIRYYYSFWSRFLKPKRSFEEMSYFVFTELNRLRNQRLIKKIGFDKITRDINEYITEDSDSFINYLTTKHGIKIELIKNLSK